MPETFFRTTVEGQPKVRRSRGKDLIIRTKESGEEHREFASGSHWSRLERGDPDKMGLYYLVTTGERKLQTSSRGERKIERELPSGKTIRIFREGTSFKVKNYQGEKNPDRYAGTKDGSDPANHEYWLSALDACHIAMFFDNVLIEPRRENLGDLGDEVQVDDQRPEETEDDPKPGCPECGGPKFGRGFKHEESCSKHK